jgi:hypothetical protein
MVTPRAPNQSKVFSISRPLDGTPIFSMRAPQPATRPGRMTPPTAGIDRPCPSTAVSAS